MECPEKLYELSIVPNYRGGELTVVDCNQILNNVNQLALMFSAEQSCFRAAQKIHSLKRKLYSIYKLDVLQILHPHLDVHSVLMVQLFGVDMFYRPSSKHDKPGIIKSREGPPR